MVRLENLIPEIYANGAELLVNKNGAIGLKGSQATPQFLYNEVWQCKDELLKALTGDPLQGPGWTARTSLYRAALAWLDSRTPDDPETREKVTQALCQPVVVDRLNEAWIGGDFETFRAALREYISVGLSAL